jgi:hypothetical protein
LGLIRGGPIVPTAHAGLPSVLPDSVVAGRDMAEELDGADVSDFFLSISLKYSLLTTC